MIYIFIFIIGTVIGSFCNALINRTIRGESIIYPPSHCETCGKKLPPIDLVPIISYLGLRGRCRYCKAKIPTDNLIMELAGGILALLVINPYSLVEGLVLYLAVMLALVIAMIDLKTFDIYIAHTTILTVTGLIYRYLYIGYDKTFFIKVIIFIGLYGLVFLLAKGSLGDGDIFFYLSLIPFIKTSQIHWFIIFSIWIGAICAGLIAFKHKSTKIKIPFCIYIFLAFILIITIDRYYL